jgi:hypothetical protein
VAAGAVFVTFVFTLIHEPASIATLAGILVLSAALDSGVTVELTMLQRLLDTTSFTGWRSVAALALPLASD